MLPRIGLVVLAVLLQVISFSKPADAARVRRQVDALAERAVATLRLP